MFVHRRRPISLTAAVLAALVAATVMVGVATAPRAQALGHGFVGVSPARLMDTRPGQTTIDGQFLGTGVVGAASTTDLIVGGRGGVPAGGVAAVVLNVTAINPSATSFVTIFPTGTTRPTASNLNTAAGRTMPNLVVVRLGTGGKVSIYNNAGTTHLAVDVLGWYGLNSGFTAVDPARLMETRAGQTTVDGLFLGAGPHPAATTRTLQITGRGGVPADGVTAVALNVTAINPSATSFVTVFPTGTSRPTASNLNTAAGRTLPNMVIVKLGTGGQVDIYNNAGSTDLAVDVLGWFGDDADQTGVSPARLMDTRAGQTTVDGQALGAGAFGAATTRTLQVSGRGGVPSTGVTAVALNVTAINPSATSFVTIFPAGSVRPTASNLNTAAGRTAPNLVIVKLSSGGAVDIFNNAGTTDLAVDVLAWYGSAFPLPPAPANGSVLLSSPADDGVYGGGLVNPPPALTTEAGPGQVATSRDGKFVAYTSHSANLVPQDTNAAEDVFVVSSSGTLMERASVDVNGDELPNGGHNVGISDSGRYVVFDTIDQADPVADTDNFSDIYRFDRTTNEVILVSIENSGSFGNATRPSISGDGRVVSFVEGTGRVIVRDITSATTTVSPAGFNPTTYPRISGDGDMVVWVLGGFSYRLNVATNTIDDYPEQTGPTQNLSDVAVSFDGDAVAYTTPNGVFLLSGPGDYSDAVRVDITTLGGNGTGTVRLGGFPGTGSSRAVLFTSTGGLTPPFTTGTTQVYLRNSGSTTLISRTPDTTPGDCASTSPSGGGVVLLVAFISCATNLGEAHVAGQNRVVVVRTSDFTSDLLDLPSQTEYAHGTSEAPFISPDGQAVSFISSASDLDGDDRDDHVDAFAFDVRHGPNILLSADDEAVTSAKTIVNGTTSISNGGAVAAFVVRDEGTSLNGIGIRNTATFDTRVLLGNGNSRAPQVSADGRFVLFESFASNLVTGDTNNTIDLFVFDREVSTITRVSANENGDQLVGTTELFDADISADGRYIVYQSNATNLFSATPGLKVVLLDRQTDSMTMVSLGRSPSVTDDGAVVAFHSTTALVGSDTNGVADVYRKVLATSVLSVVSLSDGEALGNGASSGAVITGDGRYVLFSSGATNLVAGDTNGVGDLFVRDLLNGTTRRASIGPNGQQLGAGQSVDGVGYGISDDGGLVVFAANDPAWGANDDNGAFDVYLYRMPA